MRCFRFTVFLLLCAFLVSCDLFIPPPADTPPQKEIKALDSLVDTVWAWEAWGHTIIISFKTELDVHIDNDDAVMDLTYTYDSSAKSGVISGFNSSRAFTINEANTYLTYANWSSYGHSADFARKQ